MEETNKDNSEKLHCERSGSSTSGLISTTCYHDKVQLHVKDTTQFVTESEGSRSTVVSVGTTFRAFTSTSIYTPAVSTLHCDDSSICAIPSLCGPQPVSSPGILRIVTSGITEDTVQGWFAITQPSDREVSATEEENQIRASVLEEDICQSLTQSVVKSPHEKVELQHDLINKNISKCEVDVDVNHNHCVLNVDESSPSENSGGVASPSSSEDCSSRGNDASSDGDRSPTDYVDDSTSGRNADEYSDRDGPKASVLPVYGDSDILVLGSSSFYTDVAFGQTHCKTTRARKRKRENDMPKRSTKKRKLESPVPGTSKGLKKSRKRRASNPFDRDKFPPLKAKKKKSSLKQSTYHTCPGTCPCKTRGRRSNIPTIERTFNVTQPLYKKLLKSRILTKDNLFEHMCCDKYCSFRWFINRIHSYEVLDDYWPCDLNVYHFSWGKWKTGQ